jgi:methionyl-tRNA formyltransferase
VRAFSEWPGAKGRFYLQASDGKSKVIDLKIVTTRVKPPAAIREADGVVQLIDNALVVPCGERSALHILELQPPGKKIMGARDFCNGLRGHQILIEDTVESLTH